MVQATPVPQLLPHVPQCALESVRSAQVPPQSVWPVGQLHAPIRQMRPGAQALPQVPQLEESAEVSMQRPLQED
jgi:hypothetical protein